ncbi:hypothetical protein GII36_00165 [Candidatus Mycosynbacter amalyticus]|uniref:Uncharacterized protein n=1 Tax=Candidatus Mycosynbacter amalyticus TaxID=2665156 RepID=A0A857MS42_9BACT|nr:hypothetical protein [Candidatus Mycosynbacter amalyticus]QHN42277.1 hypothetical protein GII36_00165 [Candidatus Mycosynbacter amalyticus]
MATDDKPNEEEIKALEAQIKHDQEKPVAEHERRVRIGGTFDDAVKTMAKTPPMTNDEVAKWVKDQRKEIEDLENH